MSSIEVQGITKIYRLYGSPRDRLKELFGPAGRKYHHEFYALRDLSLSVETGETIGIIGQNGSGKSTLLKILTGVIRPTSGSVRVSGRVSSLLELGAGFNPEFTGRDNVYMNGALMGFSRREMERRLPDIVAFADIGEYINQPVRTYSSGMYMRLAFSAAINVDPDILIIDEILSVGDENFQSKCRQKIQEFRQKGGTVLLVSHQMITIENICNRVYLLDHGRLRAEGKPSEVIPVYKKILQGGPEAVPYRPHEESVPDNFKRWGTKNIEITNVYFRNRNNERVIYNDLRPNEELVVVIEFSADREVERPVFGVAIYRDDGVQVLGTNTKAIGFNIASVQGKGAIEYVVDRLPLIPGKFFLSVSVSDSDIFVAYDLWHHCLSFRIIQSDLVKDRVGVVHLNGKWKLL